MSWSAACVRRRRGAEAATELALQWPGGSAAPGRALQPLAGCSGRGVGRWRAGRVSGRGQSAPQSADRSTRRRLRAGPAAAPGCPRLVRGCQPPGATLVACRSGSRTSCRNGTPVSPAASGPVSAVAGAASPPDRPRWPLGCQASLAHGGWAPPNPRLVAPLPRCACGGAPCSRCRLLRRLPLAARGACPRLPPRGRPGDRKPQPGQAQ